MVRHEQQRGTGISPKRLQLSMTDARGTMLAQVSRNGRALQSASEEMKGDREIVMAAVSRYGYALRYATEEMKGDRKIVMAAVSKAGPALRYATEEMKGDREIVMAAVSQYGYALHYASEELRGDASMIEVALANTRHRAPLIALSVSLLSGRSCNQIFDTDFDDIDDVLRACAILLGS